MSDQQPQGPQQAYGQGDWNRQPYGQPGQPDWGQQGYPHPGQQYQYPPQAYGPHGEPPLDQPWYGVGFVAATKRAFQKYARFDGRASRGEYWWYTLAANLVFLVFVLLMVAAVVATGGNEDDPGPLAVAIAVLFLLFLLGVVVPSISVTVRRLHDADLSGWLYLLQLIPYIGGLVLLIFTVQRSKPGGARYDRPPMLRPTQG